MRSGFYLRGTPDLAGHRIGLWSFFCALGCDTSYVALARPSINQVVRLKEVVVECANKCAASAWRQKKFLFNEPIERSLGVPRVVPCLSGC